jgi:uncharacterized protein YndB with AHSA1/START domain/DNA-binding HxlR family transcriptional regulator
MSSDQLDSTFSALSDATRRAILARLVFGEVSVIELGKPFQMSLPAISKHLRVLEQAGLISRGRDAQRRPCRIEVARLTQAVEWIRAQQKRAGENAERGKTPRLPEVVAEDGFPTLTVRATFAASRARVFAAFTKQERLTHWLAIRPLTSCLINAQVGGSFRISIVTTDGGESIWDGQYREISAPERLVHTLTIEPHTNLQVLCSWSFEEFLNGTRVTATVISKDLEARDRTLALGFERVVLALVERLAHFLASSRSTPVPDAGI